jgi:hypothetical protein
MVYRRRQSRHGGQRGVVADDRLTLWIRGKSMSESSRDGMRLAIGPSVNGDDWKLAPGAVHRYAASSKRRGTQHAFATRRA